MRQSTFERKLEVATWHATSKWMGMLVAFVVFALAAIGSQGSTAPATAPTQGPSSEATAEATGGELDPAGPAPTVSDPEDSDSAAPTTSTFSLTPTGSEPQSSIDSGGGTSGGTWVATPNPSAAELDAEADLDPAARLAADDGGGSVTPSAHTGASVSQCNDIGIDGADTITCTVTITNNFTYNAATPSTPTGLATIVTTIMCTGSAVCPIGGTDTSTTPITVITQCNGAGLGGASTVTCTVTVTNNLTGYPTGAVIDSTVQQCQNPGTVSTLTCVATPPGNDREGTGGPGGQSVTQCNDSGGAGGTMTCTVTAPTSQSTGLPTTIDQCNASGTEGASTVTCTATITNNLFAGGGDDDGGDGTGGDGTGGDGTGGGGTGGGGAGGGGTGGGGGGTGDGSGSGAGSSSIGDGDGGSTAASGSVTGGGRATGKGEKALPYTGLDPRIAALLGLFLILGGAVARARLRAPAMRTR